MKKTMILLIGITLFTSIGTGFAQENDEKLGFTFKTDYVSKWISRGRECYSEDGAFFETLSVDLWKTGFKFAVTHRSATDSGWVNNQRLDYKISYGNSLFHSTSYKMKYDISYVFKNYYDSLKNAGGNSKNSQMIELKYSFPELFGSIGLVPYGVSTYDWPARKNDGYPNNWSGWVHRIGLGYNITIPQLPNPLYFTSEIAYTDGFRGADHDWSYSTLGLSTKFKLNKNLTLIPSLYHQTTLDDSVGQRKDITYCKISVKYKF